MRKIALAAKVRRRWTAEPSSADADQLTVASRRRPSIGRIRFVDETNPSRSSAPDQPRLELAMDDPRLLMIRRVKPITVEERLALFERLSRRVTWVRSANRVR